MKSTTNHIALKLREYAEKLANNREKRAAEGPDRMTTADGQGGITANKASVPADPGEKELKADMPADGVKKSATLSSRAAAIRAALVKANPALGQQKAATEPAKSAVSAQPEKAAGSVSKPSLELSNEMLCKIARAFISTDEGLAIGYDLLEKQAGAEAARAQIQEAIVAAQVLDEGEQIKQAAFEDLARKTQSIHEALTEGGVTEEIADRIIKQAALHQQQLEQYDHPLLKAAHAQGMDDAALMAAADEAATQEGAAPVDSALPMGGEALGEEEILALLQEMLASGQITEDDIAQALQATSGGGAPAAEGAAAPPAADAAPATEEKAAA